MSREVLRGLMFVGCSWRQAPAQTPLKRPTAAVGDSGSNSPAEGSGNSKRSRLSSASLTTVASTELPNPTIMDVPLVSVKGKGVKVGLTIRPGDAMYLVNQGASEPYPKQQPHAA